MSSRDISPLLSTSESFSRRSFLRGAGAAGAVLLGGGLIDACGSSASGSSTHSQATTASAAQKKKGGILTIGFTGGGASDSLDPDFPEDNITVARTQQLYNALVSLNVNADVQYDLAESITANASATEWTIRLRPGVTFHNGKDLTADDVIYTLRRILNPKSPLAAANSIGPVRLDGIKKIDKLTVRLPYSKPYATLVEQLATYWYGAGIVPVGWKVTDKPNGTGPFEYQSFSAGQRSVFVRNPNYFRHPAYVDKLVIVDFADDSSLINALISGQINAAPSVAGTDLAEVGSSSKYTVIKSKSGSFQPFCMRCDQAPFNDVRVRQAFRLLVDRPQFVTAGMAGSGVVGNDVFSPEDSLSDSALHREQDLPMAKSLLKAAGKSDLAVQLVTAPINQGTVQMAEVFAQQAKAAGVTVKLNQLDTTSFFGPKYLSWNFSQDYWLYNPYLAQVAQTTLPASPFNETHFSNQAYLKLYDQANATTDASKQREIVHEMQMIDFNTGGYVIPAFMIVNDIFDSTLTGFEESRIGESLGNFRLDLVAYKT